MALRFASAEDARRRFDELARVEPRLDELWALCRAAAPSDRGAELDDPFDLDGFDVDRFDVDPVAAPDPHEAGWCAEDWFAQHVKEQFESLVGWYRLEDPQELRRSDAYDDVYSALFYFALTRTCPCCRQGGTTAL